MRILVHKMVIDTSPLAYSFWSRDVVLLCHYSYEICKLEIGADPFDSGIGFLASEKREEIIGIGVRCDPLCTEKILIEVRDTLGRSSKPAISECCSSYTMCSTLTRTNSRTMRIVRIGNSDRQAKDVVDPLEAVLQLCKLCRG